MINIHKETSILITGQFSYDIAGLEAIQTDKTRVYCSECETVLKQVYAYIIQSLYNKGLLSKEFNSLCCMCYKEKYGGEIY